MSAIIRIEVNTLNVLEWEQEFSFEQEEYHEKVIDSFKYELENYLVYRINGFVQINTKFNFNPMTLKFKLVECSSPLKFHIVNALNRELSRYS